MTRTITIHILGVPEDPNRIGDLSKPKEVILHEYHGTIRTTRTDIDAKFQEIKEIFDEKFPAELFPYRTFNVT